MANRFATSGRFILSRNNSFCSRLKPLISYSGPGTGICIVQYHSNAANSLKCSHQNITDSVLKRFEWMTRKAPVFGVSGDNVTVLPGPVEFFELLTSEASQASRRIVLASLYLGTSPKEQDLVDIIYHKCQTSQTDQQDKPLVKVHILLDCTRGSRGKHNSRTMLLPLLKSFPDMVSVSLYHTPDLRGILKQLIPERYNEVIGLSHIKAYIFDDTVIMSGANLSDNYFTNRQDRYIMVKDCPQLANFLNKLVATVSTFSFRLKPDDSLVLDPEFNVHPFEGDTEEFKTKARTSVEAVIDPKHWNGDTVNCYNRKSSEIVKNKQPSAARGGASNRMNMRESNNTSTRILVDNRTKETSRTKPLVLLRPDCAGKASSVNQCATSIHTDTSVELQPNDGHASDSSQSNTDRLMQSPNKHMQTSISNNETGHDGNVCVTPDLPVDTWIFPLVQMGPLGITVDEEVTSQILNGADKDMEYFLASGYFNLTRKYMDIVLGSMAKFNILMASPQVNGFYGAKGISGFIPDSYTYIAKKFFQQLAPRGQQDNIHLFEYYRDDWTFHAKGLWIYVAGQDLPSLTLIGSPNFGHRSVHCDLEAQLAVITTNENLRKQLHQEQKRLYARSERVDQNTFQQEHRKVPLWVKLVSIFTRNYW